MNFINVKDNKNVFADGIHDDTKALQTCIDTVKDGGTVYFPDGTYLVSASLIFLFIPASEILRQSNRPAKR